MMESLQFKCLFYNIMNFGVLEGKRGKREEFLCYVLTSDRGNWFGHLGHIPISVIDPLHALSTNTLVEASGLINRSLIISYHLYSSFCTKPYIEIDLLRKNINKFPSLLDVLWLKSRVYNLSTYLSITKTDIFSPFRMSIW